MARVVCRSCGHAWPEDSDIKAGYRVWCTGCRTRFYVALSGVAVPDDGRQWLDEEPSGCLVCGGRLTRTGEPPCERCGSISVRREAE